MQIAVAGRESTAAEPDWDARFAAFRGAHPLTRATLNGLAWEWIDTGSEERPILVVPGGLGAAESSFATIERLEPRARVIAPTIPVSREVGRVVDGLAALLGELRIERASVFGHSLGAALAHVLVRRHPDRVDRVVLGSFGLYTPMHTRLARAFLRLPPRILAAYYRRAVRRLTERADPAEAAFLRATVDQLLADPGSSLSRLHLVVDLIEHPRAYRLSEPVERQGRVLIIGAHDDRGFSPTEREALIATYPNAQVHIFPAGGHWVGVNERAAYDATVDAFLFGT